jgi:hypothetical protein
MYFVFGLQMHNRKIPIIKFSSRAKAKHNFIGI